MGDMADDILNGDVDQHTGEWIGDGQGYPRSSHGVRGRSVTMFREKDGTTRPLDHDSKKYAKGTKSIRKELALLIKKTIKETTNITDKIENKIVGECRQAINLKYGKGWREQY